MRKVGPSTHDEANSRFSQFLRTRVKKQKVRCSVRACVRAQTVLTLDASGCCMYRLVSLQETLPSDHVMRMVRVNTLRCTDPVESHLLSQAMSRAVIGEARVQS